MAIPESVREDDTEESAGTPGAQQPLHDMHLPRRVRAATVGTAAAC